jgi:hypothetical protein
MIARTMMAAVLCGVAILHAECARAQDAQSAKVFLTGIYEKYQHGGKGIDFSGPRAGDYYDSSLVALIRDDIKANGPDNVPAIDADPICGCQDWDGIWDLKIEVSVESAQRAEAILSFSLWNPKDHAKESLRRLKMALIVERGQWRIYDIVDKSDPKQIFSMRKLLVDDLAQIRKEQQSQKSH